MVQPVYVMVLNGVVFSINNLQTKTLTLNALVLRQALPLWLDQDFPSVNAELFISIFEFKEDCL